ncbi:MAG: DUF5752 family protein [Candidatus Woesearchaeota archaeon]
MELKEKDKLLSIISHCDEAYAFILANGIKLYSLNDLKDALEIMPEDIYRSHVTPYRNDFSNWIRDVFKDYILAERITKAMNKEEAAKMIEKRIEFLKSRIDYLEELEKNNELKKIWILDFIIGFILGLAFGWLLAVII